MQSGEGVSVGALAAEAAADAAHRHRAIGVRLGFLDPDATQNRKPREAQTGHAVASGNCLGNAAITIESRVRRKRRVLRPLAGKQRDVASDRKRIGPRRRPIAFVRIRPLRRRVAKLTQPLVAVVQDPVRSGKVEALRVVLQRPVLLADDPAELHKNRHPEAERLLHIEFRRLDFIFARAIRVSDEQRAVAIEIEEIGSGRLRVFRPLEALAPVDGETDIGQSVADGGFRARLKMPTVRGVVIVSLGVGETHAIVDVEAVETVPHGRHKLVGATGLVVTTQGDRTR